jgi:biotin carboxyl carrier protein
VHRRLSTTVATAAAAALVLLTPGHALAAAQGSKPSFQMPFACGERWEASSRPTHSPSPLSVDWNRDAHDLGRIVVAPAPGIVTSVVHGGGWTTLHAHLSREFVSVGQHVDQGQVIALLGSSGGSTGPHLHYEQRLDRTDQHAVFNGVRLRYNSWVTSRNCGDVPVVGDWNGDRTSDVGVFGRQPVTSVYRERLPDGSAYAVSFGRPTDQPVVGDWDGDGQTDVGAYDPATALFTLQKRTGGKKTFTFGNRGDMPLAGDWNGDGFSDVGVFRPATHTFYLRGADGSFSSRVFGTVGSLPVTGDWDGDGRWEIGVYDQATTTFSLALADGTTTSVTYGTKTSVPAVGFWTHDAVSDLGVWDRRTGEFSKRLGAHRTTTIAFGKPR